MKRLVLIGLITVAMVVPATMFAQVETSAGTLQIGGKIKWLYTYRGEDTDTVDGATVISNYWGSDGSPVEVFTTTNVEVDLMGTLGENVAYTIELASANALQVLAANPNELGFMGVRQAVIAISNVIPSTTVYVGTGNLPLGIYQPRATNDYDLINLPLLNTTTFGDAGTVTGDYQVEGLGWQGTGFVFAIKPMDMIELDYGMGNGTLGGGANQEADLEKSWLVNLKVMPTEGSLIAIGYLSEGWEEAGMGHQTASGYIVSGALASDKLEANFDWMQMTVEDYTQDDNLDPEDLVYGGYQVTLGYWLTDAIEALVRYEFVDPNMQNDEDAVGTSEYDDLTVVTVGLNYMLAENAEVALNYLLIMEPGDDIDASDDVPAVDPKYQVVDNDTLLIQVQVWQ